MNKSAYQGDKKLKLQRSLETFLLCVCVSRFVIIQSNEITRTIDDGAWLGTPVIGKRR